ncbi:fibronectin type III domain-containing protein [Arachnia propionica]|uniref:Fibronectin type III domain-containing protein n=1 Tax=Arachnia propionica TaxID=1750 RepID=A0A3P1T3D4_9ACTN|nr:Ig-like domain-containing protein [Arachnia propionica]MDO5082423.1 Ig-like domain-containing protein [Arachnia propionica]RRD04002.1 fibronectin type III domain-containing protein [Arachnia propionica]
MAVLTRGRIETAAVAVLTTALGVLAFAHPGLPASEVELNDGGIWVTNQNLLMVGHLNYEAQTLDGGFQSTKDNFDVSQAASNVLVTSSDKIQPVDVASVSIRSEADTSGLQVSHNGDLVLFADPGVGRVWATDSGGAGTFSTTALPLLKDLSSPRVVVGVDGVGHVITKEGAHYAITPGEEDPQVSDLGVAFPGGISDDAQLSVIGDVPVVLDQGELRHRGRTIRNDDFTDAVLQQPGPDTGRIALSSPTAMLQVDTGNGRVTMVEVPSGEPAAPVQLEGCVHALWARTGYYLRDCEGADFVKSQYDEIENATDPVFRTNRKVVVINDTATGVVLLPMKDMARVDNWELIKNQLQEEKQVKEEDVVDGRVTIREFTNEQNPPEAVDDQLGARPGTSTTLPVLLNDTDIDGDVLTAVIETQPEGVQLALADEGRQIRAQVPSDMTGEFTFTYRASDGNSVSNPATVTVKIRAPGENSAPERVRNAQLTVAERASLEYSALGDWVDPDGDPIFLASAASEQALEVSWRPDGYVAVKDLGTGGPGKRAVNLTVSDGTESASSVLDVYVVPGASNSPPIANSDHFVATVGEAVTLEPLLNDTDADADKLSVVEVEPAPAGTEIKTDYQSGQIRFTASQAGSYLFVYGISDGGNSAKGRIRVDVIDPATDDKMPLAENDLALLPAGGSVVLDALANDRDPTGGVLVIQGVSLGSSKELNVEMIAHARMRISAPAGLQEAKTFQYTISNGHGSATAKVLVVPRESQAESQPPVAKPDQAVVRAQDIVTVSVLGNDYSPSDLDVKLQPELDVRSDAELGEFFVSDQQVRFRSTGKAGTAEALYTIRDSENRIATSSITITINDYDEANQQPVPGPVVARTFTGKSIRVPIPLEGVDPDGDFVQLVGLGQRPPQFGSVTVNGNSLIYSASSTVAGTDTFTYRVADQFGAEGEGTIRIGVAPAPTTNQAPVTVPDTVFARPASALEIPALANDLDPDGDQVKLVNGSVRAADETWDPQAEVIGQKIRITTPEEAGQYRLLYGIQDGGGIQVEGLVTVNVDPNVPPVPPVARDDFVPEAGINDKDSVEIEVLNNDSDPDGAVSDLKVSVEEPASVRGGVVRVPVTDERQVLLYTVTDKDGLTAKAAVVVPGRQKVRPQINQEVVPARVKGGEQLVINLDEYVVTRPGNRARLTRAESVTAGPGGNTELPNGGLEVVDEDTIRFTPATTFSGPTSVSFEVTDGETLEDPRALRATLSVPVLVLSSGLTPPSLRPSEVTVAPGEGPVSASLAAMVDDPDPGDNERMSFKVLSASEGISASTSGKEIQVTADATLAVGAEATVQVEVHDGSTDPLTMTVPVRVLKTTRPLMQVADIEERNARLDQTYAFDLKNYVTNPFADVGGEISIVGVATLRQGSANVSQNGTVIEVTPTDPGTGTEGVGDVVVSYRVADATKEASRERNGTITLSVKGKPRPPTNVTAEVLRSKTARVTWTHAGWRGGTPRGFTVIWDDGEKFCGLQTTCDIDTLRNGKAYTFTVVAEVTEPDIDRSAPSSPSNQIWVDGLPNRPGRPSATFGDRSISLAWDPVGTADGGSPVNRYTISIQPADALGRTRIDTTGTSHVWDNLNNGTAYTFTVTAHNRLTDEDPRVNPPTGDASAPQIPAGAPSGQGPPTVSLNRPVTGVTPSATLTWGPPANPNGDADFRYEVRATGGDLVCSNVSSNQCTISMDVSTSDRTFEMRVTNKSRLWSPWSSISNKVRPHQPPGQPGGFSLTPTHKGREATFNFSPASPNGARDDEISYEWNVGDTWGRVSPGETVTSDAFVYGRSVTVNLRAVATVNGQRVAGETVSATVAVSGPPAVPVVSATQLSGNEPKVRLGWEMPGSSNGASVTAIGLEITTGGAKESNEVSDLTDSTDKGTAHDQRVCIRARAKNEHGEWSDWSGEQCADTIPEPRPAPTASMRSGPKVQCPDDDDDDCHQAAVELRNWNPDTSVSCQLNNVAGITSEARIGVDGSGNRDLVIKEWVFPEDREPKNPVDITASCRQA